SAFTNFPSRNVIICLLHRYNVKSLNRQSNLFRLKHEREIDALAFRDIKAAHRKESPALRWVCEKCPGNGRRQNDEARTGHANKLDSTTRFQRREKTFHARAKIPDQTWLLELDRSKLHIRLQRRVRHLKELICGKEPRHHRREGERNCDPSTPSSHGYVCQ